MNIGEYQPYLAFALGAGETTVARMTNAYAMLVNHGRELQPRLIDYVQDRNGRVIFPARYRPCQGCNARDWNGQAMPRFSPTGRQLMDPLTAFQTGEIGPPETMNQKPIPPWLLTVLIKLTKPPEPAPTE